MGAATSGIARDSPLSPPRASSNAARLLRDGDVVFVGVGLPNLACNLARRTHAPDLLMIYEAGVIGAVLVKNQAASFQTASLSMNEPITRDLGAGAPPRALVRFAPDACVADITALLDNYQATIVDGAMRYGHGANATTGRNSSRASRLELWPDGIPVTQ